MIRVRGLDDAKRAVGFDRARLVRVVCVAVAGEAQTFISWYPPKKRITRTAAYGVSFFSARQRRGFFARLRKGAIVVPYQRTGADGQAWRVVPRGSGAVLFNGAATASLLHSAARQSRMAAMIGWRTDEEAVRFVERDGTAQRAAEHAVRSILG